VASIVTRARWDGTTALSVRWRELGTRRQRRITVGSEQDANDLVQYLNGPGREQELPPLGARPVSRDILTVADVVQEHILLLIRPSRGTVGTYQRILDLHIRDTIGEIPVRDLGYRDVIQWVKRLADQGTAAKSIHNMHGLLSGAMKTAERLGYISRNPCRGIPLPQVQQAGDKARFLNHAEYSLLISAMDSGYKAFVQFLVMTGTRFGEATAIKVLDVDLQFRPPTVRINKAWKRDDQSRYYIGATKTGAGKRTIGLNPTLVDLLIPLVAGRPGNDLLFMTPEGGRIDHKPFWQHQWVPAVQRAQALGLMTAPRIHDLRHTHASWLIQDGAMSLFAVSRRLGHASVQTTEQVYGHLMPQALQDGADAIERSITALSSEGRTART
jgi:integrase